MRINVAKCNVLGIENPRVGGSIPSLATIKFNNLARIKRAFLWARAYLLWRKYTNAGFGAAA